MQRADEPEPQYEPGEEGLRSGTTARVGITVLLVIESRVVADALAFSLGADPDIKVVDAETDPGAAPASVQRNQPDIVLLDHVFRNLDGIQLASTLRGQFPWLKILILVPTLSQNVLLGCARAGAVGYLLKDRPLAAWVDSIKRVHAGEVLFGPDLLLNLLVRSQNNRGLPDAQPMTQVLGPRELDVLRALVAGLRIEEAADRLGISANTVRTHLRNVMAKLDVHSTLQAVIVALSRGLIELPERGPDSRLNLD